MKGYMMFARGKNYVKQACMCAMSLKATQEISNVSIVTDDTIPSKYKGLFDHIFNVPWRDDNTFYWTEHRWKVFHLTPYEETVVLDTDMIFLNDVSRWWEYLKNYDVCFTKNVYTYRNNLVTSDYYRKAFTKNNLPLLYCAYHYFKKNDVGYKYYQKLEQVCKEYEKFYEIYVKKHKPETINAKGQKWQLSSMDLNHAITVIDENIENYTHPALNFVHMKSKVQEWHNPNEDWMSMIPFYFTDNLQLKIGNYTQKDIFHYTENKFCDENISKFESKVL
jgi:hypothetical protein